jgi:hypothetical protein
MNVNEVSSKEIAATPRVNNQKKLSGMLHDLF